MKQWVVYIIQAKSGKLYTGITNDLENRLAAHAGKGNKSSGARFFNFSKPDEIVYQEKKENRSTASQRECEIKKMTRVEKLQLISIQCDEAAFIDFAIFPLATQKTDR